MSVICSVWPLSRFTTEAESLFQVCKFLKLEELMGKVTYEHDPLKTQKPALQKRVDSLLNCLLKRSCIIYNTQSHWLINNSDKQSLHTNIVNPQTVQIIIHKHTNDLFSSHFLTIVHRRYFVFSAPLWWRLSPLCPKGKAPWSCVPMSSSQSRPGEYFRPFPSYDSC